MHLFVSFLIVLLVLQNAFCASQECVDFVSRLSDTCQAFEYASDRVLDFEIDKAEVTAQAERDDSSLARAFRRISNADFDTECCSLMQNLNESRCFCQSDIVEAFESDISDELLAFALFTTGRAEPDGCGGAIWASFDEEECLLLGPMSDIEPETDCRVLRDEFRNRRFLKGRFSLFEEALDSTGVLEEISTLSEFVIFAPTDSAFRKFAREQNASIVELLENDELLRDVLRRHIISGNDVRRLSKRRGEVRTLQGSTITIKRTASGDFTVQGLEPLQEGVEVCRGTVNVIDEVLWPLTGSNKQPRVIEEKEEEEECLSVYETLIRLVPGVRERLEDSDSVTLFAYASNEKTLREMMRSSDDSMNKIRSSLERLIVNSDISSSVLVTNQTLKSISNESLRVLVDQNEVRINGVPLTEVDLVACNGRIHISRDPIPTLKNTQEMTTVQQEEQEQEQELEQIEQEAGEEEQEAQEQQKDPCVCSSDGVSNGVDTGRAGCSQHVLNEDDNLLFCYVKDPENCAENGDKDISLSRKYPGAYWRTCDQEEATELPPLNEAIQELDFLEQIHKYFIFARLQRNLTRGDQALTILVPSMEAIAQHSLEKLLEEGESGEELIRKLLRRHIINGEFTYEQLQQLDTVTTIDGTVLSLNQGRGTAVVLNEHSKVIRADILCSNGVIHVIDSLIKPESIMKEGSVDPCACIEQDDELPSDRLGCGKHVPDHGAFCYVQDPDSCVIGENSERFPGRKWRSCVDPCRCSKTGLSGRAETGLKGCKVHFADSDPFCYVADPKQCKTDRPSETYKGAGWKYCGPRRAPRSIRRDKSYNPCDCSIDGYSGDIYTGHVGCGRFNDPFAILEVCYVMDPKQCWFSIPSIRYNKASWRFC
eukprot:g8593.t1